MRQRRRRSEMEIQVLEATLTLKGMGPYANPNVEEFLLLLAAFADLSDLYTENDLLRARAFRAEGTYRGVARRLHLGSNWRSIKRRAKKLIAETRKFFRKSGFLVRLLLWLGLNAKDFQSLKAPSPSSKTKPKLAGGRIS